MSSSKKKVTIASSSSSPSQVNQGGNSNAPNEGEYQIIYDTFTVCPVCSFVEKQNLDWIRGRVVHMKGQVWFMIQCEKHGNQEILYCSDINFFMSCLRFSPGVLDKTKKAMLDIEEIHQRLNYKNHDIHNTPLVIDVSLYHHTLQFFPDETILQAIKQAYSNIPQSKNFILRVSGKLAADMNKLNDKVQLILKNYNKNIILLELTFDRIIALSKISDNHSVLLNNLVYPSVQIYIQKGEEKKDVEDLKKSLQSLMTISNLQIIVTLILSRPFPDLTLVMKLLRSMKGLIRFIIVEIERQPSSIMKQFQEGSSNSNERKHFVKDEIHSVDPVEVLKLIETCTNSEIKVQDFFPASVGMIMEPFLNLMGFGNYNIRPSPFCGFATILANSETLSSVPVSRIFDISKLYNDMIPIVQNLQKDRQTLNALFSATQIKKSLQSCIYPNSGYKNVDLWSYITASSSDKDKVQKTRQVLNDAQVLIIHNQMDVGVIDAVRRTRCSVCCQGQQSKKNTLTAACTGCL